METKTATCGLMSGLLFMVAGMNQAEANPVPCAPFVPEASSYTLVYTLPIPIDADYNNGFPLYTVDNTASIGSFDRVAYCLELDGEWIWVSMDAFTTVVAEIGVPVTSTGAIFQQQVSNMNVESSDPGIATGTGITTGNIEFWPDCYDPDNWVGISGASDTKYDFGDAIAICAPLISGYGSMQVHNYGAGQTLFAYNAWDHDFEDDLGIGNSSGGVHPDWTFAANAGNYAVRNMYILVRETNPVPCAPFVPEANSYTLVYTLPIPDNADYDNGLPLYGVDKTASIGSFDRIAYCLELDGHWLWVSMDAFTTVPAEVGVPVLSTGATFQQHVANMNVASSHPGVVTGSGINTGNIEFWPGCYDRNNAIGIPGASGTTYDFGDAIAICAPSVSGYGSMQVHNYGAGQTLFAYNAWNHPVADDLGIGNSVGVHRDWTFVGNAGTYGVRNLHILVRLNSPPIAQAGPDQSIHAGETVNLDGSASFDDNTASATLEYSWSFFSKPGASTATLVAANTATPSFVADVTGTYVVELLVTDEAELDSAPDHVAISSHNLPPTAVATVDFTLAIVGVAVNFDGSDSTDPELDPVTYSWTITAAPVGSAAALVGDSTATPSLTADVEGNYEVSLSVSDFLGAGSPTTVSLVAVTPANFAEIQIVNASDFVEALLPNQVTSKGNQNAFGNFLTQAISELQKGKINKAIDKLNQALERTDGCALRGSPDGNGPGRDWITVCAAQSALYELLTAAVAAL